MKRQENKFKKLREQCKIISLYITFFKKDYSMDEFPYSKEELLKALQTIFGLAVRHRREMEFKYHKRLEEEAYNNNIV